MNAVLLGVVVYVVVQFALGLLVSRRISSEADYVLAGRRLGIGLATFTVFATWFGSESVVGAAGNVYSHGLSAGSGDPFGYAVCLFVLGFVFAVPLWRRQYTTFGDFFRERYSPGVERLFVLLAVPSSIFWAAAQIRAFGHMIDVISDVPFATAVTVAAFVVITYTTAGGLLATALTDLIQSIALIIGLLFLGYAVVDAAGGVQQIIDQIDPARLQLVQSSDTTFLQVVEQWAVPICGATLAAEMIARILATRTAQVARNACLLGGGLYLLMGLIPVTIGLIGPDLVPGLDHPEQIIPEIASRHMSTFVYILFAGALISAILSTVDSALLAAASLISHNVLVPLKPDIAEGVKVRFARLSVVALGLIAYSLALGSGSVYELIETAVAIGTAGVFVVGVFGLFTRIGGPASGYAALISGAGMWYIGSYHTDWSTPYLIALASAATTYLMLAAVTGTGRQTAAA